jgi:xanthine dehydrogenase molybdenum-binding subunit
MKVLERMAGHASGPYEVPTIDVEAIAVRTNNPICGAFRGFGANQAQFAMEGVMDRLAAKAGIDGWTMRQRNVIMPGRVWGPGQIMDDGCLGASECLTAIKPAYDEARAAGKAIGLGLGLKNSGLGNGFKEINRAVIRFKEDGRVEVRHGWTEMGQGINTVALQVAVHELGIDGNLIDVIVDTTRELGFGHPERHSRCFHCQRNSRDCAGQPPPFACGTARGTGHHIAKRWMFSNGSVWLLHRFRQWQGSSQLSNTSLQSCRWNRHDP